MILRNHRVLRAVALILVFVLGGLCAGGAEWLRARRAARWSASAEVRYPAAWYQIVQSGQQASAPLTPQTAVEQALAAVRLIGGAARFGAEQEGVSAGPTGEGLRATVQYLEGQQLQIRFHYTSSSADRAVSELNTIVGVYAAQVQLAVARELLMRASGFRAADDRLKEEVGAIRPELDRLADRAIQLAAYRADSRKPAETHHRVARTPGTLAAPGEMKVPSAGRAENESRSKLETLRERRDQLLRERTPAHPDVRHVEALIAEAEKQLEELPTPVPETGEPPHRKPATSVVAASVTTAPVTTGPAAPSRDAAQWTELFRAIQTLQVRVEALSRAVQTTCTPQSKGYEPLLRADFPIVQWAERAEMTGSGIHSGALLWAAIAAGMVLTAGAAMLYTGARIDSAIEANNGADVERLLDISVVGTITTPEVVTTSDRPLAARWKRPCLVAGAVVIAAYFAFLLQSILI